MADTTYDCAENINWTDDNVMNYSNMKANEKGGKSLRIFGNTQNVPLRLQTPIIFTWGISEFSDESGKPPSYSMQLQFPNGDFANEECTNFLNNMMSLENKIKADIFANARDWAGKAYKSSDIVDEVFTPILKYPKIKGTSEPDMDRMPAIRIKIPQWNGDWKCDIYDEECRPLFLPGKTNNVTPLEILVPKINVACVIECGGLWYANGKFSVTWKLCQAMVKAPKRLQSGKCIIKTSGSQLGKFGDASTENDDYADNTSNEAGNSMTIVDDDEDTTPEEEAPVAEKKKPTARGKKKE